MAMRTYRAPNQVYLPQGSRPLSASQAAKAERDYKAAMKFISPAQQKLMWPTMIGGMFDPTMFGGLFTSQVGKIAPNMMPMMDLLSRTIGGGSMLLPRMLSDVGRSARMPYERQYRQQLGTAGKISSLMSVMSLLNAPGSYARAISMMAGKSNVAASIPRLENFLTGTGMNRILGKGGAAVEGGGILSAGYRGLKGAANYATGGKIAELAGAKTGVAGLAGTGLGVLDKGISSILASPTGLSLGLAGVSIVASIRKSMKLARLQPNRKGPDKFARKLYSLSDSNTGVNKVLAMAQRGVDPQTLSFMLLQIQVTELQRLNMQIAGFRGEYQSENDFTRQEKDKGTGAFGETYGKDVMGEDKRSMTSKAFDKLEYGALRLQEFNPVFQISKTIIDMITGRGFKTSKMRVAELKKQYGFGDEIKEMKEKALTFGTAIEQTRLLHTPSKAIADMAPTFESKKLAFLSAIFDVNRFMLAELMTIRLSGFGIDQNILHRKEPGAFKQFMSDMFEKLNPANLPGVNAIISLAKGAFKITKGVLTAPNKLFSAGKKALTGIRDLFLGEGYTSLRDKDEWAKAAGLYIPSQEKAQDFIANGLPDKLEQIRAVLFDIYYANEEMVKQMGGEITKAEDRLVWSPTEKRYITMKAAIALEESQKIELQVARAKAFRAGPLGKLLFVTDLLTTPMGGGKLGEASSIIADIARMSKAEQKIGAAEIAVGGEPVTFETQRRMTEILADVSSIKSTLATATTSLEEIRSEELLKKVPTSAKWQIGAGITSAASILGVLFGGPVVGGILGGTALATFLKARQEREKEIRELREREIANRNMTERMVEIQEEYFAKPYEERYGQGSVRRGGGKAGGARPLTRAIDIHELSVDSVDMWKLEYFEDMSWSLKDIKSYLGDDRGSVYELLEPGKRVAEVTIDQEGSKRIGKEVGQYITKQAAAKGGRVSSRMPVLVGEQGPEVMIPDTPGLVVPNKALRGYALGGVLGKTPGGFGIFSRIHEMLRNIFIVNNESLKIETEQRNEERKDALQLTMVEKLQMLKDRMKEKAQEIWQSKVLDLLGKKTVTEEKKPEEVKKEGGGIFDFLKNIAGSLLGDIGANIGKLLLGGLAAFGIWELLKMVFGEDFGDKFVAAIPGVLSSIANFAYEQIKGMSAGGRIATFAIAGAGIGYLFGPMGILTGALIGGAVGGVVDSIMDMVDGYKAGGISGAIDSFLTGTAPGTTMTAEEIFGNAGKWALMGAGAGFLVGGPFGMLVGGLAGFVFGGAVGAIKNLVAKGIEAGGDFITKMIEGPEGIARKQIEEELFQESAKIAAEKDPVKQAEMRKVYNERYKNKEKLIAEATKKEENRQQASWASSGVPGQIQQTGTPIEDQAWRMERDKVTAKVTTIAERNAAWDAVDKKYGKGKYAKNAPATPAGTPGGTPPVTAATPATKKATPATPAGTTGGTPLVTAATPSVTPIKAPTYENLGKLIPTNTPVGAALQEASSKTGVPFSTLVQMANIESKFNPKAFNTGSKASGLFQFIPGTWKAVLAKHGRKHGFGPDTSPFDVRANSIMGAEFLLDNQKIIQNVAPTSPPSPTDFYIAHQQGAGGAKIYFSALRRNPNMSVEQSGIPIANMKSNPAFFYKDKAKTQPMTMAESYSAYARHMKQPVSPDQIASAMGGTGQVTTGGTGGIGEKLGGIGSILATAAEKIQAKFIEAFTKKMSDTGLRKTAALGTITNPTAVKDAVKAMETKIEKQEVEKSQEQTAKLQNAVKVAKTNRAKFAADQTKRKEALKTAAATGQTFPVQRGIFGTEITNAFTLLERDIFSSLDRSLIKSTSNYPFESKMQHI